jgi:hypothetical protein
LSANGDRSITALNVFAGLLKCLSAEVAVQVGPLLNDPTAKAERRMLGLLEAAGSARIAILLDNFETVLDAKTRKVLAAHADLDEALRALLKAPGHEVKVILTTQSIPADLYDINPGVAVPLHTLMKDLPQILGGLPSPFAERILLDMEPRLSDEPEALLSEASVRTEGNPRALQALVVNLWAKPGLTMRDILEATEGALPENVTEILIGMLFKQLDPFAQKVMQALAIYGQPVEADALSYLLRPYVTDADVGSKRADVNVALEQLGGWYIVHREGAGLYYLHSIDRSYALRQIPDDKPAKREELGKASFSRHALLSRAADYFEGKRTMPKTWKDTGDLKPQLQEFELRCEAGEFNVAASVLLSIHDYLIRWGQSSMAASLYERLPLDCTLRDNMRTQRPSRGC